METLELLGVALGLGTLAGINLYLTVFVTGLAIRMEWIALAPQYEHLSVLGDPVIITVAGILYFLEFFADKVPWVDSLWDTVHTVIRPIGGALLAVTVLGEAHPVYDVLIGLLAGGMALTSHAAKAGTRLLVNVSPEPFTNIGVSVAEDAVVLAGLGLVATQPVVALVAAVVAVGVLLWLIPGILRSARVTMWFLWRRIGHLFQGEEGKAVTRIPESFAAAVRAARGRDVRVEKAVPCVSGAGLGNRNCFGWLLISTNGNLDFVTGTNGQPAVQPLLIEPRQISYVSGWICDRLEFRQMNGRRGEVVQFDRSRRRHVVELAEHLRGHSVVGVTEGVPA